MVLMSRPQIVVPEHAVTADALCDALGARFAGQPGLEQALRAVRRTGIDTRYWYRPLTEALDQGRSTDWPRDRWAASVELACRAARAALAATGVPAADVDCLIAVSATGYALPGLASELIPALGLRNDIRVLQTTQGGCVGGMWGLIRAGEQTRLYPGQRTLLVTVDVWSHCQEHDDASLGAVIERALFADAAGACLLTSDPTAWAGPSIGIDLWTERTLPELAHLITVWYELDGPRIRMSAGIPQAVAEHVNPLVVNWLKATEPLGATWLPEWTATHTGGPKVLDALQAGLDDRADLLAASRTSLRTLGNVAGTSVLHAAAQHWAAPPRPGAPGLLLGMGPGFTVNAARATWVE